MMAADSSPRMMAADSSPGMMATGALHLARQPGTVLVCGPDHWQCFAHPVRIIQAATVPEVMPALEAVQHALEQGWQVAGFLTYEAAPAFDAALVTHPPGALPCLWFGVYREPVRLAVPGPQDSPGTLGPWQADLAQQEYDAALQRIKLYIAAGDTYQVNFTFRLRGPWSGSPLDTFVRLVRAQRVPHAAYVNLGRHHLCSLSPELFFELHGHTLTCRPMKGTAPRGRWRAEDREQAQALQTSLKNRAENVMIVDMLRNDLGRVARPGTVRVTRLWEVERYTTLLQMTSTITAHSEAPLPELMRALFPCASITGAPKVRTMEIIRELETTPRGIYTGCIGYLASPRQAVFNVAIRTLHLDEATGRAEYGTGGGIVWDSQPAEEFAECTTKAELLLNPLPEFSLLETLLWRPRGGYYLWPRHLQRLMESARYFDFRVDRQTRGRILTRLQELGATLGDRARRIRLLLGPDGEISVQALELPAPGPWTITLAGSPIDPGDRFLYHKTTHRKIYQTALAARPGFQDVLLWNPDGLVTESTIANVVARFGDDWRTPPVSCGLLPGTFRGYLLARGRIREAAISLADLARADEIYLINSVRKWVKVEPVISDR